MKLSIVTVCYNSARTIENTIKSVLAQSYSDKEYIIVDGGSTDGTLDIIRKYEAGITKWISEPDKGISDAFNKGIKMATGDYICLLNADDCFAGDVLQSVADMIRPGTDVFHNNMYVITGSGKKRLNRPNCDLDLLLHKGMVLNHPGMFISKVAYEKYGMYNTAFRCVMDRELLARMYTQGAIFQYGDINVAVYPMDGISTKRYLSITMPEGYRISRSYGTSRVALWAHYLKPIAIILMSRCRHKTNKLLSVMIGNRV